jgi:hypothetical protein
MYGLTGGRKHHIGKESAVVDTTMRARLDLTIVAENNHPESVLLEYYFPC